MWPTFCRARGAGSRVCREQFRPKAYRILQAYGCQEVFPPLDLAERLVRLVEGGLPRLTKTFCSDHQRPMIPRVKLMSCSILKWQLWIIVLSDENRVSLPALVLLV